MVEIVEGIRLPIIFPSRVAGSRSEDEVESIEHQMDRMHEEVERYTHAGHVVEMLDRVHAKTGEGFDISITMVKRVDVFVERSVMKESVRKGKMPISDDGYSEYPEDDAGDISGRVEYLIIGDVRKFASGPEVGEETLPGSLRSDTE